jgi:endo-1,4-beta-xylanase
MRHASSPRRLAAVGVSLLFVISGCAGTGDAGVPDPAGTGGSGGSATGGASGDAGQGGSDATAGTMGTGGQSNPGTGGSASAGRGGTTGSAGRGGTTGTAGTTGSAGRGGTTGSAGRGGTTGAGGAGPYTVGYVGNITTNNAVDTDGKVFSKYWDQISPENAGKWGSVQANAGAAFNWRTLDAIYDYAQTNNIMFKEHTFIWGSQQPGGTIGQTDVQNWMNEFCKRYPNTKMIDVVNEPPPHTTPSYANNIGGGTNGDWKWIANAFTWARAACPGAVLILNDYNNIEWSNDNTHYLGIISALKTAGAPIDAIGAQAHDLDIGGQVTPTVVKTLLTKLATTGGLPIYVTELDLSYSDDNQQLTAYQQWFPLLRDSGYVKGITIWGWIYGKTWSPSPNSGLIRNGAFRPAMTWLMQQLGRPTN